MQPDPHANRRQLTLEIATELLLELIKKPEIEFASPNLPSIAVQHASNLIDCIAHTPQPKTNALH